MEESPAWGDFVKWWEEPCDGGSVRFSACATSMHELISPSSCVKLK